jgi:signal transduction histidine kinase
MTRRITVAMLVTVWAILLVGAVAAYLTTRSVLLANLDESLMARAASLPQLVDETGQTLAPASPLRPDDRYIVRNEVGQTVGRPTTATAVNTAPQLLHAAFAPLPDGGRMRTVTLRAMGRSVPGGELVPVTITFSGSAAEFDEVLNQLGWALGIAGVVGALLSAWIAQIVAVRCLRPLHAAAQVVGTIDERNLDRRIDQGNLPPELLPVATRVNEMLARLEDSLRRRKQFTADASHELRTPVAALVTAIEVALRRDRDPSQYRQALQTCLADAHLLQRLVEALLVQVKSEWMVSQHSIETIELAALVQQCVAALAPLAEQGAIRIDTDVSEDLRLRSQPDRLRSILMNLVGNAIEHNRTGGSVRISAEADDGMLRLAVSDTGPGIAREHLGHLFEPFYRADAAHAASGHLGLGLYLVRTHAKSLGGSCDVSSQPGAGATFEVKLPGVVEPSLHAASTAGFAGEL